MIRVEVAGKNVDLPPDAKISFKLTNPLFTDDELIPGDYSFPFELASPEKSPANAATFQHVDVMEAVNEIKQPCTVYYDDAIFRKGEIKTEAIGETLSAKFIAGISTIARDIKTKNIKELVDEDVIMTTPSVAKKLYLKPANRAGFLGDNPIKVNGRSYDGVTLADLVNNINSDVTTPRASATLVSTGTTPAGYPAPFITLVSQSDPNNAHADLSMSEDLQSEDFPMGWIWIVEAELPGYYSAFNAFYSSYKTNSPINNKFRIPPSLNLERSESGAYKNPMANLLNSGNFEQNIASKANQITVPRGAEARNNLQPFVMLRHVFEKAATYFGITFGGDWVGQDFYNSILIHNSNPLGFSKPFVGDRHFLFWPFSFNLQDLVPNMSFINLLKALQTRYNLAISYNDQLRKIIIKKRKLIVESTAKKDISRSAGIPSKKEDQRITGIRIGIEKTEDLLTPTDFFETGLAELTIRVNASETELGFAPQDLLLFTTPAMVSFSMPNNKSFPLRLITYAFTTVPTISANRTMATIYNDEYKTFLQQRINRKAIKLPLYWDMRELLAVDFDEKLQYDRNDYFIAWLDVELMMDRIEVMATLYKC